MKMKIKKFEELSKIVPVLTYQRMSDENTIVVSHDKLLFAMKCLKLHFGYQYQLLTCISGVDFIGKDYIIECKGRPNESFPLRWKLFKLWLTKNNIGKILYKPQNQKEVDRTIALIKEHRRKKRG